MNYILKYYYGIDSPYIFKQKKYLYIKTLYYNYIMLEIDDIRVVEDIVKLLEEYNIISEFYEIMNTNAQKPYIETRNKKYVLLRVKNQFHNNILLKKIPVIMDNKYQSINRSNWYFLWSQKNDNINTTYRRMEQGEDLDEFFDYFIGIAENAILYLKQTTYEKQTQLYITRKRLTKEDIKNPINIVLDRRERDIAEIIKYIYFNLEDYDSKLKILIELSIKEHLSFEIIFARVLYPTNYFDLIESGNEIDKCTLDRFLQYEKFLNNIYNKFIEKKYIKKIDWF